MSISGTAKYTDTPLQTIPLFSITPGAISGSVRVLFNELPTVGCNLAAFPVNKANLAKLATALAAGQLSADESLSVATMIGGFPKPNWPDPTRGAYKLAWETNNVELSLSSGAIGTIKAGTAKKLTTLATSIPAGDTHVAFTAGPQYCPPNGWTADFQTSIDGTKTTPKAGSCAIKFSKTAPLTLSLDCSKLVATLETIDVFFNLGGRRRAAARRLLFCGAAPAAAGIVVPQGDHLQMWLTLTSTTAKGSVALSTAVAA